MCFNRSLTESSSVLWCRRTSKTKECESWVSDNAEGLLIIFMNVTMVLLFNMCVSVHMYVFPQGSQKKASDPLEMEL